MLLRSRAAVGDAEAFGRRVTSKAPLAHLVGGSGRSEVTPTAILQDTHSLEGVFSPKFAPEVFSWHHGFVDTATLREERSR